MTHEHFTNTNEILGHQLNRDTRMWSDLNWSDKGEPFFPDQESVDNAQEQNELSVPVEAV